MHNRPSNSHLLLFRSSDSPRCRRFVCHRVAALFCLCLYHSSFLSQARYGGIRVCDQSCFPICLLMPSTCDPCISSISPVFRSMIIRLTFLPTIVSSKYQSVMPAKDWASEFVALQIPLCEPRIPRISIYAIIFEA